MKVVTAHSTSLDGFIADAEDSVERVFRWFEDGDTPSRYYPDFRMSAASAAFFDEMAEGQDAVGGGDSPRRELAVSLSTRGVGWHCKFE